MANTPKKKSSRAKPQKTAATDLDAARHASKAAAASTKDSNDTATNPFQPPFGMNMPPIPMGQPGMTMGGPNPMMPPMPPGAFPSPTANGSLLDSVGTMIKLGIDTINAALAGSNQLLQGISGASYHGNPYPHHYQGCDDHGYMHSHHHHCCEHNHYHDSYGHSCCDQCGDSGCCPSVHNCCK